MNLISFNKPSCLTMGEPRFSVEVGDQIIIKEEASGWLICNVVSIDADSIRVEASVSGECLLATISHQNIAAILLDN